MPKAARPSNNQCPGVRLSSAYAQRLPAGKPIRAQGKDCQPGGDSLCVTVLTYCLLNLGGFNKRQGLLTPLLAGAYFLGFLGVAGACRKSPMKSSRKVHIIPFLSDVITHGSGERRFPRVSRKMGVCTAHTWQLLYNPLTALFTHKPHTSKRACARMLLDASTHLRD